MTSADDRGADEPTVTVIVSWVGAIAAIAGLVLTLSTTGKYHGIEDLGVAVAGLLGLGLTLGSSAVGAVAAAIGLKRAQDNNLRMPVLNVALILNILAFCGVFLMFGLFRT